MLEITTTTELPNVPAVYVLYGKQGQQLDVAYVGITGNLKSRIEQHLIRRNSSVTTGMSVVLLNPDYVTEVRWWEHTDFGQRPVLEAAEMVAFELFEPRLRSRGRVHKEAQQVYNNETWRQLLTVLLTAEPTGRLILPTLDLAFERLDDLEKRLARVENSLKEED